MVVGDRLTGGALSEPDADRVFHASQVLAKHDEKYMPPEAVEALKRAGEWHGDQQGGS